VKLQYLGDSRDAFKWDLLHWLCTRAEPALARLLFVPLLTPDDAEPRDWRTPHAWFQGRPLIRRFVVGPLARGYSSTAIVPSSPTLSVCHS
jgi:hypothetical protein